MHLLGIELFEVEDNKMLYDTIFEFKTFEDTEAWLKHEIIRPIIDQLAAREDSQYKNISEKSFISFIKNSTQISHWMKSPHACITIPII